MEPSPKPPVAIAEMLFLSSDSSYDPFFYNIFVKAGTQLLLQRAPAHPASKIPTPIM
jgi:hypothetical protein